MRILVYLSGRQGDIPNRCMVQLPVKKLATAAYVGAEPHISQGRGWPRIIVPRLGVHQLTINKRAPGGGVHHEGHMMPLAIRDKPVANAGKTGLHIIGQICIIPRGESAGVQGQRPTRSGPALVLGHDAGISPRGLARLDPCHQRNRQRILGILMRNIDLIGDSVALECGARHRRQHHRRGRRNPGRCTHKAERVGVAHRIPRDISDPVVQMPQRQQSGFLAGKPPMLHIIQRIQAQGLTPNGHLINLPAKGGNESIQTPDQQRFGRSRRSRRPGPTPIVPLPAIHHHPCPAAVHYQSHMMPGAIRDQAPVQPQTPIPNVIQVIPEIPRAHMTAIKVNRPAVERGRFIMAGDPPDERVLIRGAHPGRDGERKGVERGPAGDLRESIGTVKPQRGAGLRPRAPETQKTADECAASNLS